MYFFLSEVCPPDAMFCRDVTKREVSSLFSLVAAWLRRLADQNNSFSAALPPLPQHGPWTGENGKPSRTFSEPFPPHFYLPSSLRFLGDWTAPARASGAPLPACLLLVFTEMLSQSPVFLLLARCLVARALRCAVQLCSVLFGSAWTCHGATVATAAVFYYLKSRDMCVFTQRASLSVYKQRGITFIFC